MSKTFLSVAAESDNRSCAKPLLMVFGNIILVLNVVVRVHSLDTFTCIYKIKI